MAGEIKEIIRARRKAITRLRSAAKAVLLFHSAGPWDARRQLSWSNLTGCREVTTKDLCDYLREVLEETDGV